MAVTRFSRRARQPRQVRPGSPRHRSRQPACATLGPSFAR